MRNIIRAFSVILLVMCGVVFTTDPAGLLALLTQEKLDATYMPAESMTYFTAAPECLGILWGSLNILMSTYYPIAVVIGILSAILFLFIFMKKTIMKKTLA